MQKIAVFRSSLKSKFGIPRQSGIVNELAGAIVLEQGCRSRDAVRGLEDFDYLWLIWEFSANKHEAKGLTVRPPRLGGNERLGVFATRSPFRPNPIGLSCVRLSHIDYEAPDGPVIHVLGADLMDGTPILDIKPYLPYTDAHPEARAGFTDAVQWQPLDVEIPSACLSLLTDGEAAALRGILSQDPRPQYHDDPNRIYGMPFCDWDVMFRVDGGKAYVESLRPIARQQARQ